MSHPKNVAILIFKDVEVLDFAGPFEVFSITGKRDGLERFNAASPTVHGEKCTTQFCWIG